MALCCPLENAIGLMLPLHSYLVGTGSWFLAVGIQGVMFAWLVTMVLRESPEMVGVAQMTLLLPGTLLILVGGSYADRFGGRRVAVLAQSVAVAAPLILLGLVVAGRLTFGGMLAYAVVMGCAQAFVTPARDGLLNQVAGGRVQRTVMFASLAQFGLQMLGFFVASVGDITGPGPILGMQAFILAVGAWAFSRMDLAPSAPAVAVRPSLLESMREGSRTVLGHSGMRTVALLNVAMSTFFMGAYIVTLPLLVREVFDGSARDLGLMNICNSVGLVLALLLALRLGGFTHQGRALLSALMTGSVVLCVVALAPSFVMVSITLFFWGACGGIAMTMSRTIMQEQAPEDQRGRVMGFNAFSFMGAGPIGALASGFLVDRFGPQVALAIAGAGMACVVLVIGFCSSLWRMTSKWAKA